MPDQASAKGVTAPLLLVLAEAWNGTSWTIQSSPSPPSGFASSLLGVSCYSTSDCTAVGDSTNSLGDERTLAEVESG